MEELEKTARALILAITEKTLKSLKNKGLLKEPSELQRLYFSPEMKSLIKKLSSPKYDPCRKFRKGDLVRLKAYNGRKPYDFWHKQTIEHFGAKLDTVLADELDSGNVDIFQDAPIDELTVRVHASHLELVTPVEELEISRVFNDKKMGAWVVTKDNFTHSYFPYRCEVSDNIANSKEEAKAAAEAECARLNAEYRKEMEK